MSTLNHKPRPSRTFRLELLESRELLSTIGHPAYQAAEGSPLARAHLRYHQGFLEAVAKPDQSDGEVAKPGHSAKPDHSRGPEATPLDHQGFLERSRFCEPDHQPGKGRRYSVVPEPRQCSVWPRLTASCRTSRTSVTPLGDRRVEACPRTELSRPWRSRTRGGR